MEKYFKNTIEASVYESATDDLWDDINVTIEWSLTPVFSNLGINYWIVNVQSVKGELIIERPPFKKCCISGASEGMPEEHNLNDFSVIVLDSKIPILDTIEIDLSTKTITVNFY